MSSGSNLLNQILGNKTTAVYGDANVQAATIVPDLNNISDGSNLNVVSDSGQLNIYQALTLNDNFLDTRTEEVFQTNVSNNVAAIQVNQIRSCIFSKPLFFIWFIGFDHGVGKYARFRYRYPCHNCVYFDWSYHQRLS